MGMGECQLYLWVPKFEFDGFFACYKAWLLLIFFQPFKKVKDILSSQTTENVDSKLIWPVGHSLSTFLAYTINRFLKTGGVFAQRILLWHVKTLLLRRYYDDFLSNPDLSIPKSTVKHKSFEQWCSPLPFKGNCALKAGFLVSLHPQWGLMPKEPLSFANMSPIGSLAVRDLASESVPVGSFLTAGLLKKLCVIIHSTCRVPNNPAPGGRLSPPW